MSFDLPSNSPVTDRAGGYTVPWFQWFSRVHTIVSSLQQSGTTADRPTKLLWVGRRYFDTTLGVPVWWNGSAWINSSITYYHATAVLNFPSIASNAMADLTISVPGAAENDRVILGAPAALETEITFDGFVSAADTVTVHVHNTSGGAVNPASATWTVTVMHV